MDTTRIALTPAMRRAIRKAARECAGCKVRVDVGLRETAAGAYTANALLWAPDADLCDLPSLDNVAGFDTDMPGCATLDCYVYEDTKHGSDLLLNLYVTIKGGAVVDAHDRNLEADTITRAILGRPFSASDEGGA